MQYGDGSPAVPPGGGDGTARPQPPGSRESGGEVDEATCEDLVYLIDKYKLDHNQTVNFTAQLVQKARSTSNKARRGPMRKEIRRKAT